MLDALYVKQVNERKTLECEDRSLIDDLLLTQKTLRDLEAKFKLCTKNELLVAEVEKLKKEIVEKDKELTKYSKDQIEMKQEHKQWKQKVEKADNEFGYVTF